MSAADDIAAKCDEIKAMLLAKNEAYGNSALEPLECFARGVSTTQRLGVRLDDKISRLQRGHEFADEDTLLDIAGYLVLLLVARENTFVIPDEQAAAWAETEPQFHVTVASLPRLCATAGRGEKHAEHDWTSIFDQATFRCRGYL